MEAQTGDMTALCSLDSGSRTIAHLMGASLKMQHPCRPNCLTASGGGRASLGLGKWLRSWDFT